AQRVVKSRASGHHMENGSRSLVGRRHMRCGVVLFLILTAFAMPFSVAAQETGQEFRDDLRLTHDEARRIDAAVQELMQRDAAIGVALGIVRDGEIAYLKALTLG
ncbi:MAG: hypothetical protein O7F14_07150, partial [Alphaproteobacteria bacterium]|nr:hypothetical protein [Alphaproteobacteria bacterium]